MGYEDEAAPGSPGGDDWLAIVDRGPTNVLTMTPADMAKEAVERFLYEVATHAYDDDLAQALAIEHVRGLCEGTVIAFDAACCGAEPAIHERHSRDCKNRPPGDGCPVCMAMRR